MGNTPGINSELRKELDDAKKTLSHLAKAIEVHEKEYAHSTTECENEPKLLQAEAERDFYKEKYEKLIAESETSESVDQEPDKLKSKRETRSASLELKRFEHHLQVNNQKLERDAILGDAPHKARFRLLRANDNQCIYEARDDIQTQVLSQNLIRLVWVDAPKTALLIKKPGDEGVTKALMDVGKYLHDLGLKVFVEPAVILEPEISSSSFFVTWEPEQVTKLSGMIDFIVCLGGDGTLLWVSNLFREAIPPVVSFSMGSLGFLTPFNVEDHRVALRNLIVHGCELTLRSRLSCRVVRKAARDSTGLTPLITAKRANIVDKGLLTVNTASSSITKDRCPCTNPTHIRAQPSIHVDIPSPSISSSSSDLTLPRARVTADITITTSSTTAATSHTTEHNISSGHDADHLPANDSSNPSSPTNEDNDVFYPCLNEVVVDRGPFSALTNLDCFCDNLYFTKVQADGIIIATPTGSTAYSLSAGGSMVHPEVPALCFTPICPHTLSFRPLLFPDSSTLKIMVSKDSRGNACVSFDGRNRQVLAKGDYVEVKMHQYPVPAVCCTDETKDWFESVRSILQWNVRAKQKPMKKSKSGNGGSLTPSKS